MIRLIILLASILISGCSTLNTVERSFDVSVYENHTKQLDALVRWEIKGNISIRSGNRGGIGKLYWKRDGENHRLEVYGNVGSNRIRVFQDPQGATLENSEGQRLVGRNANDVLEQQTGMNLPVDELITWIVGKSHEGLPSIIRWDTQGHPISIHQSGWLIRYSKYQNVETYSLPTRVRIVSSTKSNEPAKRSLDRSGTEIKLAISDWGLF